MRWVVNGGAEPEKVSGEECTPVGNSSNECVAVRRCGNKKGSD